LPASSVGSVAGAVATRSQAVAEILKLNWDYPVHVATEQHEKGTRVKEKRSALARAEALRAIAGNDPRPLLVLRECTVCNKTDDALLKAGADNERTLLLARWFHCVKLPVDVVEPDHPFNALFPTNDAEHLFVALRDGSGKLALESDTSRTKLWDAMTDVLGDAYAKDPTSAAKDVQKKLDKIDLLETRRRTLETRRDELLETSAADSAKVKKVAAELEGVKQELAAERAAIDATLKIAFKEVKPKVER
jgi:hypothetical protein